MKWTDKLVNQKIIIQNNLFIYYKYNKLLKIYNKIYSKYTKYKQKMILHNFAQWGPLNRRRHGWGPVLTKRRFEEVAAPVWSRRRHKHHSRGR